MHRSRYPRQPIALAFVIAALTATSASAAESEVVRTSRSSTSLVTALDGVVAGQPFSAALRLRLAPGWHVYWVNPGEAGLPPTLTVTGSPGAAVTPLQWPVPHRVSEGKLTTFAYTGDVVLPFTVNPGGGPLALEAQADWLVCQTICVPESATFHLSLGAGEKIDPASTKLIADAMSRVPQPAPFPTTITPDGSLALAGVSATPASQIRFFPLAEGSIVGGDDLPAEQRNGGLTVQLGSAAVSNSGPVPGVITITDKSGATSAYALTPKLVGRSSEAQSSLPLLLLAGFAGGLLLNLMPCVFPILAMKAVALVRLSGKVQRRLRWEAASYTGGIIATFVTLGAVLAVARSGGQDVGWGFQLQSPLFVASVSWVLFAVGLNMAGLFQVGGGSTARSVMAGRHGYAASFFTGVLAVVVAAPCTAPFMATALAGAALLSAPSMLLVFTALGVGLAMPYALIAAVPPLARRLPRPGAWMGILQQALAFPMFAAVVWLMWVISQQTGASGVLLLGSGLFAVGLAGWAWGLAQRAARRPAKAARGVAAACVVALPALLYTATVKSVADGTEPFTPARLEQLRAEGRPVFVDLTAAWCLSCLVNEQVALSPEAVKKAFADHNVAFLKGDWTTRNPAISAYLSELGREGVPVYVLYRPGKPAELLPEVLTEGFMLRTLGKLDGKSPTPAT